MIPEKTLLVRKKNETYLEVVAVDSIMMSLSDFFSFFVPGHEFMPKFRMKFWDGKIRLYNRNTGELYVGLLPHLKEYARMHKYEVVYTDGDFDVEDEFSVQETKDFAVKLKLHAKRREGDKEVFVPIIPHDYQLAAFRHAVQTKRSLLLSPTACHPSGTNIVMYDGSIKDVKNVSIGDTLMGPDGTPRNVSQLHTGVDDIFKITPKKGKPFYANGNHILSLIRTNTSKEHHLNGSIINISINDYLTQSKTFKHTHKLYHSESEITFSRCSSEHPLDPYFVGLLLGAGSLSTRTVGITTMDPEIASECYRQAEKNGIFIRKSARKKSKAYEYIFTTHVKHRAHENPMTTLCNSIGILGHESGTKFIPDNYKFTTIENRKQILAGLLDTDGYLSGTGTYFGFCSKSKQLCDDVSFIARSLGLVVTEKSRLNKKYNTIYYGCYIFGNISKIPTRVKRKRNFQTTKKVMSRTGFNIEFIGKNNFYGFTLDKDHLYLLDDFLVTHNSGKSLIIYLLIRYYQEQIDSDRKILVIVPTINLVSQMYTDFGEYSYADTWDVREESHMIYGGKDKNSDKQIIISTWESIYKLGINYFEQFDVVIGDECHQYKAKSLSGIMEKSYKAQYRIGTTGTLDGTICHHLLLEGLFGKVYKVTSTAELQEQGTLAQMMINCLMLHYPEDICKKMKSAKYQDEVSFIVEHEGRNKFIRNLALSLKGNTLVLYNLVERHGKLIYEDIKTKANSGRKVFFISGKIDAEVREDVRCITEKEVDAIIVASYGTFSTGVNIRNLHNIIFASPAKSRIRVLQSLGRGLRKGDIKDKLELYDISDVLQYKSHVNHTLKHFKKRMEIYNSEKFAYRLFKVRLKA